MRCSVKGALVGIVALAAAAAAAPMAWAGCGDPAAAHPASWSGGPVTPDRLTPVNLGAPTIVGMWYVQFFSGNTKVDFGFAQWHADGTEFMNSALHNPATQNVCMGVWAQTGPFSYHLTHYAEAYDPTQEGSANGKLAATLKISEDVTVDAKNDAFNGQFSIDVVDPVSLAYVGHVQSGNITGRRITP